LWSAPGFVRGAGEQATTHATLTEFPAGHGIHRTEPLNAGSMARILERVPAGAVRPQRVRSVQPQATIALVIRATAKKWQAEAATLKA
jgi:hypothetical protein